MSFLNVDWWVTLKPKWTSTWGFPLPWVAAALIITNQVKLCTLLIRTSWQKIKKVQWHQSTSRPHFLSLCLLKSIKIAWNCCGSDSLNFLSTTLSNAKVSIGSVKIAIFPCISVINHLILSSTHSLSATKFLSSWSNCKLVDMWPVEIVWLFLSFCTSIPC